MPLGFAYKPKMKLRHEGQEGNHKRCQGTPLKPGYVRRRTGHMLWLIFDQVSPLSSNKNYSLFVFKNFLPTIILAQQASKGDIWLNQDCLDPMIVQRLMPTGITVVHLKKLFHQLIAINIRTTINVDTVIRIQLPD